MAHKSKPTWTTNVVVKGKPYKADVFIDYQMLAQVLATRAERTKHLTATTIFGSVKVRINDHK